MSDSTSPSARASTGRGSLRTAGRAVLVLLLVVVGVWAGGTVLHDPQLDLPAGRERVVFWHFWGGAERDVVRQVVDRFNRSQSRYHVEEVPVPGQNLDMKFYMSLAGGDAPDLLNQDDQVVAQWAARGVLTPLRELTESDAEYRELQGWLSPSAARIGEWNGELYALCNAIDIRAMLYRADVLQGQPPPVTIEEFTQLAMVESETPDRIRYVPDDRRLWAWGVAFGGSFYDEQTRTVTANDPRIVAALEWMTSFTKFHGVEAIRAFRSINREAGAGSMLLDGRYGLMMDGQWRVPELDAALKSTASAGSVAATAGIGRYAVGPLPSPAGGRERAGWVNGNFFVVPLGANCPRGAWEFMKFWSGFGGNEREAALTAASGGWIPASPAVIRQPVFQKLLGEHPQFRTFVELAASENQLPTPATPVQAYFYERVNRAAEESLTLQKSPQQALDEATREIQQRLDAALKSQAGQ
ncbi:MAG: extracellular solute-binding protein [Planctomycetaceae bacterium]|nr:extracellular solute-binding protein [Planctomycetaceae bacterium]